MIVLACSACSSTDVVGPFEMDGYVRGEYVRAGAWWIVCRGCGVSTLTHEQEAMFGHPEPSRAPRVRTAADQPDLWAQS